MCYLPLLTHLGHCWYMYWLYLLWLSQQRVTISRDGTGQSRRHVLYLSGYEHLRMNAYFQRLHVDKVEIGSGKLILSVFYRVSVICWKTHSKLSGQNCERRRLRRTGARARGQSGLYRLIYDMQGGGRRMPCSLWSQLPFQPSFFFTSSAVGTPPSHRLKLTHPYTFPLPSFQPAPHPAPAALPGTTFIMFSRYKSLCLKWVW